MFMLYYIMSSCSGFSCHAFIIFITYRFGIGELSTEWKDKNKSKKSNHFEMKVLTSSDLQ